MKKFFYVAIAATALASCSSDQLVDLKEGDEIKFTAVADNDSRASKIYCNNNLPESFQLYAATSTGTKFITDEMYKFNTDAYKSTSTKRYWPENDALNFYAIQNAPVTTWEPAESLAGTFTPNATVANQVDFIYAVKEGIKKSDATNGNVSLNFRHALSQIEFNAKNENPNLKIEILGVKVGRVAATADYVIEATDALTNTDGTIVDHTQKGTNTINSLITWSGWTLNDGSYEIETSLTLEGVSSGDLSEVTTEGENVDSEGDAYTKDYKKSMLLLPQTTTAWAPATTNDKGAFLAVKVCIWNVVDDGEEVQEVLLYGDAKPDVDGYEGRWAAVPVDIEWKEGYKYIYTFNFTNGGNAGYEDTNNDGEPENVAVLVPMSVSISVDDFTNGTTTTENMVKE